MLSDYELLDGYIADMRFRALQESSVVTRERYLKKFIREVGFYTATEQNVVQWLSQPIVPKTRAMWISTLNTFYMWANHNHLFADTEMGDNWNPISDIGKPRLHARSPRPMPSEDIRRAVELADPRMKVWILLGGLQGLRCMEVSGLCREDIRESSMTLRIIGKGSKERFLPIHENVLNALREWGHMPSDGRLWPEETPGSVSRKINRFLHNVVGTKFTAHTLRHKFGTEVFRSSLDLRLCQELMGHSSPQTTAGYAAPEMSKSAGVVASLTI